MICFCMFFCVCDFVLCFDFYVSVMAVLCACYFSPCGGAVGWRGGAGRSWGGVVVSGDAQEVSDVVIDGCFFFFFVIPILILILNLNL